MTGGAHFCLAYWVLAKEVLSSSPCLFSYKLNAYIFRAQGVKQSYVFSFLPHLVVESRSSLLSSFIAKRLVFLATQKLCFDRKRLLKFLLVSSLDDHPSPDM